MSAAVALGYFSVWLLASLPFAILIGKSIHTGGQNADMD